MRSKRVKALRKAFQKIQGRPLEKIKGPMQYSRLVPNAQGPVRKLVRVDISAANPKGTLQEMRFRVEPYSQKIVMLNEGRRLRRGWQRGEVSV